MAFADPAAAWIEESALILVLAVAGFISWRALFGGLVTEGLLHENFRAFGFTPSRSLAQTAPLKKRPQWLVKASNQV
jgi:hypothetical protein